MVSFILSDVAGIVADRDEQVAHLHRDIFGSWEKDAGNRLTSVQSISGRHIGTSMASLRLCRAVVKSPVVQGPTSEVHEMR